MVNKAEKMMCGAGGLGIVRGGALSFDGVVRSSDLHSKGNLGVARKMNTMNKLMIAATAALCAAVGYSDGIESSNVVGYQTKELASDNFTMINIPFVNVSNPTAGLQLNSDVQIANMTAHADDSEKADQIWVWVPSYNGYRKFFRYAGDGGEYAPGWCDAADPEWNYIEDRPGFENGLPLGSAIYYKGKSATGKVITGSGAVEGQDEVELPLASDNFTMVGNPYPVALQLNGKDFTVDGVTANADDSEKADQIWVWVPSFNGYRKFFRYAGDGGEYAPGWCDSADPEWNYIEDRPGFENGIASGTALYFKAKAGSGKAAVFTSPLAKPVE